MRLLKRFINFFQNRITATVFLIRLGGEWWTERISAL